MTRRPPAADVARLHLVNLAATLDLAGAILIFSKIGFLHFGDGAVLGDVETLTWRNSK